MLPTKTLSILAEPYRSPVLNGIGAMLATDGALVGGMEALPLCVDGLSREDLLFITRLQAMAATHLSHETSVLTVHAHYRVKDLVPTTRPCEIDQLLTTERTAAVNQGGAYASSVATFFEVAPKHPLGKLFSLNTLIDLANFHETGARQRLRGAISFSGAIKLAEESLTEQAKTLKSAMETQRRFLSGVTSPKPLSSADLWCWLRFLATLSPDVFENARFEEIPAHDAHAVLQDRDIVPTNIAPFGSFLKGGSTRPVYIQAGTITGVPEQPKPGLFARLPRDGNYLVCVRFRRYSPAQLATRIWWRYREIERQSISFKDMFLGEQGEFNKDNLRKVHRDKLLDLENAEAATMPYGEWHAQVIAWSHDPKETADTAERIGSALQANNVQFAWQDVDQTNCYAAVQPGGTHEATLKLSVSAEVAAEACPIYGDQPGIPQILLMDPEESQLILQTRSGVPFHFSMGKDRFFCLFSGKTGVGKSILMNRLAAAWMKYRGAMIRSVDIDHGTELLCQMFGDDAVSMRFADDGRSGFNLTSSARDPNDPVFSSHFLRQCKAMLLANISEENQGITAHEEHDLKDSLRRVLLTDRQYHRFANVINGCTSPEIKRKFADWLYGDVSGLTQSGRYAATFDCVNDGMTADHVVPFANWNLIDAAKDQTRLPIIMNEIVYRIMRDFESEDLLARAKLLKVDEAHWIIQNPDLAKRLLTHTFRTGRKNFYGALIASQSPEEFERSPDWAAIFSALTTLVLFSDPKPDKDLYKRVYKLTDGEIDRVTQLEPQRGALIIQREQNIVQEVYLDLTPAEYTICTSSAPEVLLRRATLDNAIAQHGTKGGLEAVYQSIIERRKHADHRRHRNRA